MARIFSKTPKNRTTISLIVFALLCLAISFYLATAHLTIWRAAAFAVTRDGWPNELQHELEYPASLVFANLALFGTIIFAVFSLFDRLRRHLIRIFSARHTVICGLGRLVDTIAAGYSASPE